MQTSRILIKIPVGCFYRIKMGSWHEFLFLSRFFFNNPCSLSYIALKNAGLNIPGSRTRCRMIIMGLIYYLQDFWNVPVDLY
jgi:hypothetical protein